ncbi:putative methyltransferase-domain-containing protein [Hygrophoropsis aurantiaca]|uniref:Methyltransferase-domain-containing protein n=1 Tax=Hygrophoropsis aurantiaca TaxID=72124 RepID=A0ACB8ALD9_9AGAM|nr:putative methyltransferase-domain-containing protein [Hygrophoropsis aurantiaca]
MFYYISFLRPPPQNAPISGELCPITPQIANDLRTEFYEGEQTIYYSWFLLSPKPTVPILTPPRKLTVWRSSNPYKEIKMPRPPNVKNGQRWRLILSASDMINSQFIPIEREDLGSELPFPVMSMPILFGHGGDSDKQEEIERSYAIAISSEKPSFFNIKEQTSFDLDKKIWDSGVGLSSWLFNLYFGQLDTFGALAKLKRRLFSADDRNILELGAGTGIVSVTLSVLRSDLKLSEPRGHLIATDLPSAMPLLEHNISFNAVHCHLNVIPEAAVLDWENEQLPSVVSSFGNGLDVIVMADVTYNTSSFPSLINTLSRLIHFSTTKTSNPNPPLILLGYKERDPSERILWEMADKLSIKFELVGAKIGAGGIPVEIWLGEVQNP